MKRNLIIKSVNSPTNTTPGVASVADEYILGDGSTALVNKGTVLNTRKTAGFSAKYLKGDKLLPVRNDPVGELFKTRSAAAHAVRKAFDKSIGSKDVADMTTVTSTDVPKVPTAKTAKVSDEQAKREKRNARRRELRAAKKAAA